MPLSGLRAAVFGRLKPDGTEVLGCLFGIVEMVLLWNSQTETYVRKAKSCYKTICNKQNPNLQR